MTTYRPPALTNVYSLHHWRACGYDSHGNLNGGTPMPMNRFELSIHERRARKLRGGPPPNPCIVVEIPLTEEVSQ